MTIFGPGARDSDPRTSHEAAQRDPYIRAHDRMLTLMDHFHHPDGLTDFELAANNNRQQTSLGKRRGELRDMGLIYDTGRTRPAPSGSSAIVWALTTKGRELMESIYNLEVKPRKPFVPFAVDEPDEEPTNGVPFASFR
jgi:hypothetical protein